MGDRCYWSARAHPRDAKRLADIVGTSVEADGVTVIVDEMDHGGQTELADATRAGLRFYGFHGMGTDYGPALFASFGGEAHYIPCDQAGVPVVRVHLLSGDPHPAQLAAARGYDRARAAVLASLLDDPAEPDDVCPGCGRRRS